MAENTNEVKIEKKAKKNVSKTAKKTETKKEKKTTTAPKKKTTKSDTKTAEKKTKVEKEAKSAKKSAKSIEEKKTAKSDKEPKKEKVEKKVKGTKTTKTPKTEKVAKESKSEKKTKVEKAVKEPKTEKKAKTEKKVKEPKLEKKAKTEKTSKTKKSAKVENKSFQNKVIENIKSFLTKIIEVQEKVKKDEEEEKKVRKQEENADKQVGITLSDPRYLLEYYDLPYRYNETVVKILAQTPKRLFVYWDVADKDKQTYLNAFGENFFNDTYPVLLLHNEDKNYTTEIVINDFANTWYINISDPRDKYTIQLGRKFKAYAKPQLNPEIEETNIQLNNDYLFIAISNKLEVPNDKVLFEEFKPYVKYRNVKTKVEEIKEVKEITYPVELRELYKKLYNEQDIVLDEFDRFDIMNSSMGTSSSISK